MAHYRKQTEKEQVSDILQAKKLRSFNAPYNKTATDAETMGLLVAHYFDWDGEKITQAYMDALGDANFHSLRAKVAEEAKKEGLKVE